LTLPADGKPPAFRPDAGALILLVPHANGRLDVFEPTFNG
jgi:hypothetical protein